MPKQIEKNEAQEKAVATVNGQVLLISCPGSGKTTTMLRRINNMLSLGIPAEHILMVTFTDAAATEMRSRFQDNYGNDYNGVKDVSFSTIHSLCLKILISHSQIPPRIMSQDDQFSILKDAMRLAKVASWISRKDVLTDISAFKNSGMNDISSFVPNFLNSGDFKRVYLGYEAEKERAGFIDFDDILLYCRTMLMEDKTVLQECRDRYRYIMVDEYQDTNNVQKEILYLLAGPNGNLCVVGDDDQSIYGFRGANPRVMLDFEKDYPDCTKIDMSINYRSRPEIIEAARNLIECNSERFKKDIRPSRSGHGEVVYKACNDYPDEITFLLNEVKDLNAKGHPYEQIAILARTNMQLDELAAGLERERIPYHSGDSIPDVYEHFIFMDLIAYLRLINDGGELQDLMRVLNRPNRYLRESDLRFLKKAPGESFIDAAVRTLSCNGQKEARSMEEFKRNLLLLKEKKLQEQIAGIVNVVGYGKFLDDYAKRMDAPSSIFQNRVSFFMGEIQADRYRDVSEWERAAKRHIAAHRQAVKSKEKGSITLSTMHRSKGLEWNTVFLIDCCQGITPLLKGERNIISATEEERRLFYVAATRARESLYILYYTKKKDGNKKTSLVKPSMFIKELKGEVQREKSRQASAAAKQEEEIVKNDSLFEEGEPGRFRIGMKVHHREMGKGVVVSKNLFFVNIRFEDGVKMFPISNRQYVNK